MTKHLRDTRRRKQGFALLFVLFLVALLIVGSSVALVNQWTEGQRQKEAETIWRGQQYERAIGLYYRKFGRFPTDIDDLVKEQNGIRFLRQAYKNPMNKDGSWRFIYVTPTGQLIGSVRYTSLQEMAFIDKERQMGITIGAGTGATPEESGASSGAQLPTEPFSPPGTANGGGVLPDGSPVAPQTATPPGQNGQPSPAPPQGTGGPGQPPAPPFFSQGLQAQTNANPGMGINEPGSTGPVIGGFIIGVAGKSNTASIKIYQGGTTYKQWEFIFNPLEQVQTIGGLSSPPATPAGQLPGMPPLGAPQPPQPQPPQPPIGIPQGQ
ncbi:MAG TPA: hypothetical protein VNF02_00150 [Candidatus Limnocylindrales bacterium]|nr:hypothetical protein [Candidatus Limnocylindrales bacterium]